MCLHSGVRDVRPPSIIRWQRGLRIIFQAQRTYICLTDGPFTNYTKTTACSLDGPDCFLLWGFVWLHSSLQGHACMYVKKKEKKPSKNSTFADPGQWSVGQRGPPCPFVYIITQVLSVHAARLLVSRPLLKPTCNLTCSWRAEEWELHLWGCGF